MHREGSFQSFFGLLLTISVFFGYYLISTFGPSSAWNLLVLFGLASLVVMAFFSPPREMNPHSPTWVRNSALFLLTTITTYFLAKYVSLLFHEWSHALWANLLGVRSGNVLNIHYGHGWVMKGIWAVDSGDFYQHLFASRQDATAALVAFGGPLTNLMIAMLSLLILFKIKSNRYILTAYLFFWMAQHNLAQLWSYTPARTMFHDGGDIFYLCKGLHIPPWLFLIAGTAFLGLAFYLLFVRLMFRIFEPLHLTLKGQIGIFFLAWTTVFLYYGGLPIIYDLSSLTDPGVFLLILELSVGLVLAGMVIARFRNTHTGSGL